MKISLKLLVILFLLTAVIGCGGGGGGSKGRILGRTTDEWGAPVGGNIVSIIVQGLADIYHPDSLGNFNFSIDPGSYDFEFLWYDEAQGVEINHVENRNIVDGDNNLGDIKLTNNNLSAGWSAYRNGNYNSAITFFNSYLTDVRNGHANMGSNSAFCALGWCYARTENVNASFSNFNTAVTSSQGKNSDALVGLGGLFLSLGHDGTNYTYGTANTYFTSALSVSPNYSSSPTHDHITSTDVYAARALARFLNGDVAGCQSDITQARQTSDTNGNFATLDTLNMLEWLVGNI